MTTQKVYCHCVGVELRFTSAYFTFKQTLYRQSEGFAMGSPIPPIITNFYLNSMGSNALTSFRNNLHTYLRYADDTFAIQGGIPALSKQPEQLD